MKAELPKTFQGLPVVDSAVMRLFDRAATEKFKIPELELMENAGRAVAGRTLEFLQGPLAKAPDAAKAEKPDYNLRCDVRD